MTTPARTIPKLTIFVLTLAALAAPASATITYTSCSTAGAGACSSSTGTYAIWQTAPGSAGLTFSISPTTFGAGNLSSGVYTDPSGTVLTGYTGTSTIDTAMSVSGTSLLEGGGAGGPGSGIEIKLPTNTYAFAMHITTLSGSGFTNDAVAVGDHNVGLSNYPVVIGSGGGASNVQFFGIISDVPLPTTLFVGPITSGGRLQLNDFELGQATPTPEVSTVALIGSGLVLLGLLRRRRVHKPHGAVA